LAQVFWLKHLRRLPCRPFAITPNSFQMARAICMAIIFMLATAIVQANQCPSGGECPSDDEPQNLVSLLQAKLRMNVPHSSLNDIVGQDGVLVLTLDRTPDRFQYTAEHLALGGILATRFSATDVKSATDDQLGQGCLKPPGSTATPGNCFTKSEQACADSHRRALLAASSRKKDWTAIFEDDMALLEPTKWDQAFKKAWAQVPQKTKIVRLSWCMIEKNSILPKKFDKMEIYADTGDFVLSKWVGVPGTPENPTGYDPGACTGAYMVHKDILNEMLNLFPCKNAVDWCYSDMSTSNVSGGFRGMEVMMNMAAQNSRAYIEKATHNNWLGQHGVLFQDRMTLASAKDESKHPGRKGAD